MTEKIKVAIIGYGNIGHYVLESLLASEDMEIAGVIRRDATNVPPELNPFNVVSTIDKLPEVDVAILCTPTREVEKFAKECLSLGIRTVDSFDIHGQIPDLRKSLDATAKKNKFGIYSLGRLGSGQRFHCPHLDGSYGPQRDYLY